MVAFKGHFDGKVIVPDEPLNLPRNQPLMVRIEPAAAGHPDEPALGLSPTPAQRVAGWEAWVSHMRTWAAGHLPPGHTVDDSRDAIYAGRGE